MKNKVVVLGIACALVMCGCGGKNQVTIEPVRTDGTAEAEGDNETIEIDAAVKPVESVAAAAEEEAAAEAGNAEWKEAFISVVEWLDSEDGNSTLFNLLDMNKDGIPELVSFDCGGWHANISLYRDGQMETRMLYDNSVRPEEATDYGAYAAISCENNRIIVEEFDTTYEKDGGLNYPGAEWLDMDGRQFEHYVDLTMYEINDSGEMVETDHYTGCYIYEEMQPVDELYEYREGVLTKAFHYGDDMDVADYQGVSEMMWSSDVYLGSAQDIGTGMYSDQIIELLSDESFVFMPGDMYRGESW